MREFPTCCCCCVDLMLEIEGSCCRKPARATTVEPVLITQCDLGFCSAPPQDISVVYKSCIRLPFSCLAEYALRDSQVDSRSDFKTPGKRADPPS